MRRKVTKWPAFSDEMTKGDRDPAFRVSPNVVPTRQPQPYAHLLTPGRFIVMTPRMIGKPTCRVEAK